MGLKTAGPFRTSGRCVRSSGSDVLGGLEEDDEGSEAGERLPFVWLSHGVERVDNRHPFFQRVERRFEHA